VTASTLNAFGYSKHTNTRMHAVAFAPQQVFGCGLLSDDLRIEQEGVAKLQSLLNFISSGQKVGSVS
jgi:hypothetical protein